MSRLRNIKVACPFPFPWRGTPVSSRGGFSGPILGVPRSSFGSDSSKGSALIRVFHSISASLKTQCAATSVIDPIHVLDAVEDSHGGLLADVVDSMDSVSFRILLRGSLAEWKQMRKRGIWIKLPIRNAHLVAAAVEEGFRYHHAEPDYLMLVRWLPSTTDTIPANASHRVGIGAFVMNDKGELLVVQEKSGKFKGTGLWKLPTGIVNEGEDIHLAAVREVEEETGIKTEFQEILAVRQIHDSFFTKSDLFFVCKLKPRSSFIQKQNLEIEAAQWMPIQEYSAQPYVLKNEQFKFVASICQASIDSDNEYKGFTSIPITTGSGRLTRLYCNKGDPKRPL